MVSAVDPVLAPRPTADDRHFWDGVAAGSVLSWIIPRHPPVAALDRVLRNAPAEKWFEILDAAGVPCEISSSAYALDALDAFDDAELRQRRWTVEWEHPHVGRLGQRGLGVDMSETPEILREAGYPPEATDRRLAWGPLAARSPGDPTTPPGA
jgi:hypothetical protein